jgi:hypothetical protein
VAQTSVISDVPPDQVDAIASDYKTMGASKLEVIKQDNGLFTLKITVASDEEEQAAASRSARHTV